MFHVADPVGEVGAPKSSAVKAASGNEVLDLKISTVPLRCPQHLQSRNKELERYQRICFRPSVFLQIVGIVSGT